MEYANEPETKIIFGAWDGRDDDVCRNISGMNENKNVMESDELNSQDNGIFGNTVGLHYSDEYEHKFEMKPLYEHFLFITQSECEPLNKNFGRTIYEDF